MHSYSTIANHVMFIYPSSVASHSQTLSVCKYKYFFLFCMYSKRNTIDSKHCKNQTILIEIYLFRLKKKREREKNQNQNTENPTILY